MKSELCMMLGQAIWHSNFHDDCPGFTCADRLQHSSSLHIIHCLTSSLEPLLTQHPNTSMVLPPSTGIHVQLITKDISDFSFN